MTQRSENLQPSLFEAERGEIAAALAKAASGGSGDDQDHD